MAKHLLVSNIIALVFSFFRLRMRSFSLNHSANKIKPSDNCDSIILMILPSEHLIYCLQKLKITKDPIWTLVDRHNSVSQI